MTTEILTKGISLSATDVKTTGVFGLTRGLTTDESAFLTLGSKSKFKRALHGKKARLVDDNLKDSENAENVLNLLSFVSYVGQTFIKLDSKGLSTPEKVASTIKGLEAVFSLPAFANDSEPVKISFGSATFRISDKEFYKVSYDKGKDQLEVQSGMFTPVWNPPVTVDRENDTVSSEIDKTLAMS